MGKAPAFQFYPNDWLSSAHVAMMTPAEEGAYIRLLCYAWSDPDCSIPDDDETLSRLSRLGEGWLKGGSQMVRKCFEPHPTKTGRLVNVRLLSEREKQARWREKSKQGGINSGKSRGYKAKKQSKGGSKMVEPNGNSSVFGLQSSSTNSTPQPPKGDGLFLEFLPSSLDAPSFIEKWKEWVAYRRKEAKKAITATSAQKQFKQMEKIGVAGAINAMEESMACGWQGVFPKKAVDRASTTDKRYLPGFGELEHYDPIPANTRR